MTTLDKSTVAAVAEPAAANATGRAAGARARARAEVTEELLSAARGQLAQVGAGSLSLRAVAREVGMTSSAIYRYFPSRDDLLTRLIVEAYDAVGEVAERAWEDAAGAPPREQFRAVWHAVRQWALVNPHQYALIFGSPVPGYAAPVDTIAPATRLPEVLLGILATAVRPESARPSPPPATSAALAEALSPARATIPRDAIDDDSLLAAITSWTTLLGSISFQLFGHTHNVVAEDEQSATAYFDAQIDLMLSMLGMA